MKDFHLEESQRERLQKQKLNDLLWLVSCESVYRHSNANLEERIKCIPYGKWRVARTIGMIASINHDLLETVSDSQSKRLLNQSLDNEMRIVPKLTPPDFRMTLNREESMQCVDLMRAACKECILDGNECRGCVRYKMLTALVPLESYDNLYSCPYSTAEWVE